MNDIFNISKLIIKKKLDVLSPSEKEQLKAFKSKYPFVKDIKFKTLADKAATYNTINKEAAWNKVLLKTKVASKNPSIPLYKKQWFKYAAAASVLLMVALSIFLSNSTNTKALPENNTPIIVNNNINAGSHKATLTLSDGSTVVLEKGKNFTSNNINSNGEALIYTNSESKNIAYNYLTIPRGGQFFITLADGTQVWINSESQLKYPVSFIEGTPREVELIYGEAYFDVSPSTAHQGATFKVQTNQQTIEVLGTEFNVKAYKDEAFIYSTLVEGKVSVSTNEAQATLTPKQQAVLNGKTITVKTVNLFNEISWKKGVFSFTEMPLKDIMKVLARWYDCDIEFKNQTTKNIKFNGVLGKEQAIEDILTIICTTNNINYEINDKQIIIK